MPRAGRERGVVRGVGEGRRGRPGPGRRSGAPSAKSRTTSSSPTATTCRWPRKIEAIATRVLTCRRCGLRAEGLAEPRRLEDLGFRRHAGVHGEDAVQLLGRSEEAEMPRGFRITVRNAKVSAGFGFVVSLTGDIMTMPGLPKVPAAERIDVDETGKISGLFEAWAPDFG